MGRFAKNTRLDRGAIKSSAYTVRLPNGTSTVLPRTPAAGDIYFNTSTNKVTFYDSSAYQNLARTGRVTIVKDYFIGNGSTTAFSSMSYAVTDPTSIMVFIGGVYQEPYINYTCNGTSTITFTSAPPAPGSNPNRIVILHGIPSNDADQTNPVVTNFNGVIDGGTY